ncbi:MAG: hypothetical protein MSD82_11330, partial [Prevotella sp.]|nr:hypothetical protein [Prevotella sp.]
ARRMLSEQPEPFSGAGGAGFWIRNRNRLIISDIPFCLGRAFIRPAQSYHMGRRELSYGPPKAIISTAESYHMGDEEKCFGKKGIFFLKHDKWIIGK